MSYLPEERGLYKKMTVRDLLRYYGRLKSVPRARLDGAIDALARAAADRRSRRRCASSRCRRAGAEGAVHRVGGVSEPELLILDEPFSGLDPVNAEALKDAVLELRDRGTTIVFSTHDMSTAERLCDRIFMIFRGKKVLDGTLAEIQEQYGADTIRVRTDGGRAALDGMPGVEQGGRPGQPAGGARHTGDAQAFLQALVARTTVQQFEITRPSLHDIFVRIAQPTAAASVRREPRQDPRRRRGRVPRDGALQGVPRQRLRPAHLDPRR